MERRAHLACRHERSSCRARRQTWSVGARDFSGTYWRYFTLEGEATRRLRKALDEHPRLRERNAIVKRHVDIYTGGTLDLRVSIQQFTLWIEVKILPRGLTKLQQYEVKQLGDGAVVVSYDPKAKAWIIGGMVAFGYFTFTQLVEEIVSRCVDNGIVQKGVVK